MILAVMSRRNSGIGFVNHYNGFLFDTDVQSAVEQFMLDIHCNDYFLVNPDELIRNKMGCYMYNSTWIMHTSVRVQVKSDKYIFTIE